MLCWWGWSQLQNLETWLLTMNYNTYEVLLGRDNGYNKTVHVHDCMYEDEARLLAESTYGLPVLRVLYKGSSVSSNDYDYTNHITPRHMNTPDFTAIGNLLLLIPLLATVLIVVEFWLPILIIAFIVGLFVWYKNE